MTVVAPTVCLMMALRAVLTNMAEAAGLQKPRVPGVDAGTRQDCAKRTRSVISHLAVHPRIALAQSRGFKNIKTSGSQGENLNQNLAGIKRPRQRQKISKYRIRTPSGQFQTSPKRPVRGLMTPSKKLRNRIFLWLSCSTIYGNDKTVFAETE